MSDLKVLVFVVHGGMTFKSRDEYVSWLRSREVSLEEWKSWSGEYLRESLGSGFQVVKPRMPCREFAQYEEWRIHFERFLSLLRDGVVLVGSSLGGLFLAQYLSEHRLPVKIGGVFLVAPPFDDSLSVEDLAGGFELGKDLSLLEEQAGRLVLFFSEDDPVVPLAHAEKYRRALPRAEIITFESKNGHFVVEEFPEIVALIKEYAG